MKKAKYIIVNSEGKYFVKISEQNKIVFTQNKREATEMYYSDTQDLIPIIELYDGHIAIAEEF